MTDISAPPEVSVSFVPHQLPWAEQWRFVLRRVYSRAIDPLRSVVKRTLFLVVFYGLSGVFINFVYQNPMSPLVSGGIGAGLALIFPLWLWRIKRILLRGMGPTEIYTVGLGPAGATVENATRVLLLRWTGATGVLATRHEVVIQYRTLDVVSVPARAFRDDAHLGRFVTLARSSITAAAEGKTQA